MEDHTFNIEGLCPLPHVQIPPNFKMSKMNPLNKIGNPKNHLKQYVWWRAEIVNEL